MNIASYIDHTILKPSATIADVQKVCTEAALQSFAAVCIPPCYVADAKQYLEGTPVKIATVIGFPFGYSSTPAKVQEIKDALYMGADELDVVHNIAALKSGNWQYLEQEIAACVSTVHMAGKIIKVIVESGILSDDELVKCCHLYSKYGIDFMKTSTGYAEVGATVHAVTLMRQYLPVNIAIKASGGIRTFKFAKELIDAGATRLGCSASMQIVKESNE